jgi:hypothetical protein
MNNTLNTLAINSNISNLAQAEIIDNVRNDSMIRSFDDAIRARELINNKKIQAEIEKRIERLPFTVKIATSDEDLEKVVKLRHDAYARHAPEMAAKFQTIEEADRCDIVLLAESKFDGSALGTMRIYTNQDSPLPIESVIEMPHEMRGKRLVGASRLAIKGAGGSRMVRDALLKAFCLVCDQMQMDFAVISARIPVDRMYEKLDFKDIREQDELIPLPYAANVPHRVLVSEFKTFYSRWTEANHPLCDFFWNTTHPDIRVELADQRKANTVDIALRFA